MNDRLHLATVRSAQSVVHRTDAGLRHSRTLACSRVALVAVSVGILATRALAQPTVSADPPTDADNPPALAALPVEEAWAVHGQSTVTEIFQPAFRSPYRGQQSLSAAANGRETWDVTLYAGLRPWRGAEIWVNPEVDQGFGPSNTFGVAGYPSAEAYKLGAVNPYVRLQRVFLRQTVNLGGEMLGVEPDQNQLGGSQAANRVVITLGKFSSFDVFDTNKYAHDPRNDFLNWSLIDAGSFDQAGDAWGYTYGASVEWYQNWWTVRTGAFDMPVVPGYKYLDTHFGHQMQYLAEFEERHTILGHDGKVKLSGFYARGLFGDYGQAVAQGQATGATPDVLNVLRYRSKAGASVNVEQELTDDLGMFFRAGTQNGGLSVISYTDIDNSISGGLSLAGKRWGRPDDTVGLGIARNDISRAFKNYLNAGGLSLLIGDGKLPNSGPETVVEAYYSFQVFKGVNLTADYQFINNPAYNRDRGPANFLGARLHAQF